MPALSVWSIRLALAYLLTGFTFGSLILAQKGIAFFPAAWALLPAHIEFLVVGWTVNLIFGVAYWILPRFPGGWRGPLLFPLAAVSFLNLGVVLAAGGRTWASDPVLLAGRTLQAAAVVLFAVSAWRRVRPTAGP
jgi:hypothetical protein